MFKNIQKLLFLVLFLQGTILLADQKQPMKILMVVATFPKIHDICMLNQMTGMIDRGHEVHMFASSKGDCINVQEDVIMYDLVNKTFEFDY